MQVYLAVQDPNGNTIVVQKRELNRWWGGNLSPNATLVNQAGQWALPGGRKNIHESNEAAAIREFHEETGVDLSARLNQAQVIFDNNAPQDNIRFALVRLIVNQGDLQNILNGIQANIAADPHNPNRPVNARDWEHQAAVLLAHNQLVNHLGVRVPVVDPQAQIRINQLGPNHYSQAIDWYAQMVPHL